MSDRAHAPDEWDKKNSVDYSLEIGQGGSGWLVGCTRLVYDSAHSLTPMTSSAGNGLHLALMNWKTIIATKEPLTTGFLAKLKQDEASEKQTSLDTAYGE